jgi:MinD superfamily P-loop ATPase
MRITVASGKGGTGKTTIATSLALSLAARQPILLDCDVEAPNAHLFLNPIIENRTEVSLLIPEVNEARCTHCGRCAEVCPWHAIAVVGNKVLVFPQLCHGCGSCTLACPEEAVSEVPNPIGAIEEGSARPEIDFGQGQLYIGEPMAVPIIRQLKQRWRGKSNGNAHERITIIDAPPGTTCPVVEAMRGSDFALLVTEPTPFGLHDLRLAVQVAQELGIPAGVIINRDGVGDGSVEAYCYDNGLPVLMRIPLDRRIAQGIARGTPLVTTMPEYFPWFRELYRDIVGLVARRANGQDGGHLEADRGA